MDNFGKPIKLTPKVVSSEYENGVYQVKFETEYGSIDYPMCVNGFHFEDFKFIGEWPNSIIELDNGLFIFEVKSTVTISLSKDNQKHYQMPPFTLVNVEFN